MTGFARHEGQSAGASWVWEFRSVNGKGLDVRLRLPPGFESLEPIVRKKFQNHFSRGNIQANLSVSRGDALYLPSVNEPMLEAILNAVCLVESKADLRQSSARCRKTAQGRHHSRRAKACHYRQRARQSGT